MRIGIPFKKDSIQGLNDMLFRSILLGILCAATTFFCLYLAKRELIPYHDKAEMTGYYEKGSYGDDGLTITLTNGEKYRISTIMYGFSEDSAFNKKDFNSNVRRGDMLQFTYFRDDEAKYPYIYEIKSEGHTYLSFEDALEAMRKNRSDAMLAVKVFFILAAVTIVSSIIRYHLLKQKLLKKQNESSETKTDCKVIRAAVPGVVKKIYFQPNQKVKKGDTILIILTMKMEIPCPSPCDGIIENIYVHVNDGIQKDMVLVTLQ